MATEAQGKKGEDYTAACLPLVIVICVQLQRSLDMGSTAWRKEESADELASLGDALP